MSSYEAQFGSDRFAEDLLDLIDRGQQVGMSPVMRNVFLSAAKCNGIQRGNAGHRNAGGMLMDHVIVHDERLTVCWSSYFKNCRHVFSPKQSESVDIQDVNMDLPLLVHSARQSFVRRIHTES
jgi:hypothetical protein